MLVCTSAFQRDNTFLFSDLKHGSRAASLLAAIAWRDATEKKIGKPRTDRNIVSASTKNAGVVRVRLNEKLNRYDVSWVTLQGKQGKTSVSILKYGKGKAFQIACERRKEKEAERLFSSKKIMAVKSPVEKTWLPPNPPRPRYQAKSTTIIIQKSLSANAKVFA